MKNTKLSKSLLQSRLKVVIHEFVRKNVTGFFCYSETESRFHHELSHALVTVYCLDSQSEPYKLLLSLHYKRLPGYDYEITSFKFLQD